MAEIDRGWIAAVLTADTAFQTFFDAASFLNPHRHELPHARRIERLERVARKNFLVQVVGQERIDIVA